MPSKSDVSQFLAILESSNLSQRIHAPTYNKGLILDLVILRNDSRPSQSFEDDNGSNQQKCEIQDISVHQNILSDHHCIHFRIECSN